MRNTEEEKKTRKYAKGKANRTHSLADVPFHSYISIEGFFFLASFDLLLSDPFYLSLDRHSYILRVKTA